MKELEHIALTTEAAITSETLVSFYQTIRCHLKILTSH